MKKGNYFDQKAHKRREIGQFFKRRNRSLILVGYSIPETMRSKTSKGSNRK